PACQFAVHIVAVLLFYLGLRCIALPGWLAMGISSMLLYSKSFLDYVPFVMTDGLSSSLAIATVAMLLVLIGRPRSAFPWIGLPLSLLLIYQVRPAYLFLIPLLPVLGLIILALVVSRQDWVRLYKRVGLGLVAVGILPLLAFCTFRWAVVGHFGLVSFAGHN